MESHFRQLKQTAMEGRLEEIILLKKGSQSDMHASS